MVKKGKFWQRKYPRSVYLCTKIERIYFQTIHDVDVEWIQSFFVFLIIFYLHSLCLHTTTAYAKRITNFYREIAKLAEGKVWYETRCACPHTKILLNVIPNQWSKLDAKDVRYQPTSKTQFVDTYVVENLVQGVIFLHRDVHTKFHTMLWFRLISQFFGLRAGFVKDESKRWAGRRVQCPNDVVSPAFFSAN